MACPIPVAAAEAEGRPKAARRRLVSVCPRRSSRRASAVRRLRARAAPIAPRGHRAARRTWACIVPRVTSKGARAGAVSTRTGRRHARTSRRPSSAPVTRRPPQPHVERAAKPRCTSRPRRSPVRAARRARVQRPAQTVGSAAAPPRQPPNAPAASLASAASAEPARTRRANIACSSLPASISAAVATEGALQRSDTTLGPRPQRLVRCDDAELVEWLKCQRRHHAQRPAVAEHRHHRDFLPCA